jgi:anti-sigma B factor antagonist
MEPNYEAADASLQVSQETRGDTFLVHFEGGFSLINQALLARTVQEIKAAADSKIVMDLAGVTFMDSLGVGVVVSVLKNARTRGIGFAVVTNDVVDQILGVANLSQVMQVTRSLAEALQ